MDFFEAQARARQRSSRLVALFTVAVVGTALAAYAAAVLLLATLGENHGIVSQPAAGGWRSEFGDTVVQWWQPGLLAWVFGGTLAVVGVASLFKWLQFSSGGSRIAENVGGTRVDPRTTVLAERRLLNVVEEMAIASGTPVPAVYVLADEPGINAFAAGLTTSDAAVAVTRGTLEKLSRDELQGVIGHEFSHILNGDMRLNTRLTALLFGILVLGLAGRTILWNLRHVRPGRSRNKNGGGFAVIVAVGIALLIIGYVGYFFGRLIQAAVSRQREFLADASAVQFTRNPAGISGALKKIGGYALGSAVNSTKSAEIGHFFFAQGFRSRFGGLWATHPPLDERIRAVEPAFDGKYFEPAEVVDVETESFVTAGLVGFSPAPRGTSALPPTLPAQAATTAVARVGTLSAEHILDAQRLLATLPEPLRHATHDPATAAYVVFALLLSGEPAIRQQQTTAIAQRQTRHADASLDTLHTLALTLRPEQRLPLVQLAVPALRQLSVYDQDAFLGTLDALVQADAHVTVFEFALRKLVSHSLLRARSPAKAIVQYHAFAPLVDDISVLLSALAHASTEDPARAPAAFSLGAAQLPLVAPQLQFLAAEHGTFTRLDRALERLAGATGPIKQRTLVAAAHVVGADGQIRVSEAELLRAFSAALDCPMPPLAARFGP